MVKYKHVRLWEETYRELRKFKNLYELQDQREYTLDDILKLLMKDRLSKRFVLPITQDKKEIT